MDDARLANLMFLVGLGSLAIPGCAGSGEPGVTSGGDAPGNPLATHNALGGSSATDACSAYIAKLAECGGGYDDDDDYYGSGYYGVSVAPGYSDYCDQYLGELQRYGAGCVEATVGFYACLSELSCQELGSGGDACNAALFSVAENCDLGGGGGGSEPEGE